MNLLLVGTIRDLSPVELCQMAIVLTERPCVMPEFAGCYIDSCVLTCNLNSED